MHMSPETQLSQSAVNPNVGGFVAGKLIPPLRADDLIGSGFRVFCENHRSGSNEPSSRPVLNKYLDLEMQRQTDTRFV